MRPVDAPTIGVTPIDNMIDAVRDAVAAAVDNRTRLTVSETRQEHTPFQCRGRELFVLHPWTRRSTLTVY